MSEIHRWTEEHKDFLRVNYKTCSEKELLAVFNEKFELNIKQSQLRGCLRNHKIRSGRTGHFEKGNTPFNKGLKGVTTGGIATQFKKGHKPYNYKPVGSERIDEDGYNLVKVSDTGKWNERMDLYQKDT